MLRIFLNNAEMTEILGWFTAGSALPHGGEDAYLALVCHPSSDSVTIKITYGLDVP